MQFWLLTLITQLRKIISERWRPSCRTHVRSLSSRFCITFTNISCGTIAIYSRNGNFQIVDCTRFSNVDVWFEVTPKKEIAGRFKSMRSFCVTLYYLLLRKKYSLSGCYSRTDASSLLFDYISQGPRALWCIWSGSVARNEMPDFHDPTYVASTLRKWRLHPLSTLQNDAVNLFAL